MNYRGKEEKKKEVRFNKNFYFSFFNIFIFLNNTSRCYYRDKSEAEQKNIILQEKADCHSQQGEKNNQLKPFLAVF